jgi:hypothetical protein
VSPTQPMVITVGFFVAVGDEDGDGEEAAVPGTVELGRAVVEDPA